VNDSDWFAKLYQDSYRRLVLITYAMIHDIGAAEEITQEAFALAYVRRARVAAADNPEAWIRAVAVNLARRRGHRQALLDRILRRHRAEPEVVQHIGEHVDLHRAIAALGDGHRAVVVLHYLADLPLDEIASLLDIPMGTVKSRLSRARAVLAAALHTEVDHA
jgi:RNA polymerase sigma factor (sigma-70 family)